MPHFQPASVVGGEIKKINAGVANLNEAIEDKRGIFRTGTVIEAEIRGYALRHRSYGSEVRQIVPVPVVSGIIKTSFKHRLNRIGA